MRERGSRTANDRREGMKRIEKKKRSYLLHPPLSLSFCCPLLHALALLHYYISEVTLISRFFNMLLLLLLLLLLRALILIGIKRPGWRYPFVLRHKQNTDTQTHSGTQHCLVLRLIPCWVNGGSSGDGGGGG